MLKQLITINGLSSMFLGYPGFYSSEHFKDAYQTSYTRQTTYILQFSATFWMMPFFMNQTLDIKPNNHNWKFIYSICKLCVLKCISLQHLK